MPTTEVALPEIVIVHSPTTARPIESPPQTTPGSLSEWLRFLWSRVLFPAPFESRDNLRWSSLLLVMFLSGLLLYPCLSFHLFEPDEGRYAQIPREMLERGDWLMPTLMGKPYLDKPPLFYWLVLLSYQIFGIHEAAARLVPALAVQLTILFSYILGRRLVGERSALWGALMLSVTPAFVGMGRLLILDGLLTLTVSVALVALFLAQQIGRLHLGWWTLAGLACGCGVLTKGPIALILVLPPFWLHRVLNHSTCPVPRRAWLAFVGLILAINLPWYLLLSWKLPNFLIHFFWEHNIQRFVQPFDHIRPVWYFVPILLGGLLPMTFLLPFLLRNLLSVKETHQGWRSPEIGYLLLSAGWCFLFFSISGCKLPTYILPMFPPLCLVLGAFVARTGWHLSRWFQGGLVAGWLFLLAGHYFIIPWQAWERSPMNGSEAIRSVCADPNTPVFCFPRHLDSVAFYVGRSDFVSYRSKELGKLLEELDRRPRSIVLFAHRSSLALMRHHLPPQMTVVESGPLGLCDWAIVERRSGY